MKKAYGTGTAKPIIAKAAPAKPVKTATVALKKAKLPPAPKMVKKK